MVPGPGSGEIGPGSGEIGPGERGQDPDRPTWLTQQIPGEVGHGIVGIDRGDDAPTCLVDAVSAATAIARCDMCTRQALLKGRIHEVRFRTVGERR